MRPEREAMACLHRPKGVDQHRPKGVDQHLPKGVVQPHPRGVDQPHPQGLELTHPKGGGLRHPQGGALPEWCDAYLAPADSADFFAGRVWQDTVLAHALPPGATPLLAVCGAGDSLLVPLLRQGGRFSNLVSPYTLEWRPLVGRHASDTALRGAGHGLARLLAGHPPTRFEALDADARGLAEILGGLRDGGLAVRQYRHFGNWHTPLPAGAGWDGYLAERPAALRATIQRRTAATLRHGQFTLHAEPGAELERAIAAYVTVRDQSWKPLEPFPGFDAALLRATAGIGALRLGILWRGPGRPIAAQYWVLSGGRAALLKLAHVQEEKSTSPGTVLTALMIRHLIDVDGATQLDFGRGDDAYKALWCAERRQRIGLILTDPWHPAGLLELARQAARQGRDLLLRRRTA